MPKKKNKRKAKANHFAESPLPAFRRLLWPAFGWAALGLAAVIFTRPSRLELLLSGNVEWWRLALFFLLVVALSFGAAAFNDWRGRRKR